MHLAIGGIEPFTTIDFPGRLAAVIFCRGCGWRCGYCHNRHLQPSAPGNDWKALETFLRNRQGLLDGIVFSGGEPLLQSGLAEALAHCRKLGFATGLHTAGSSPARLQRLLPLLDWVGFDVKAPFHAYEVVTRVAGSGKKALESLRHLLDSGIACEVRTTVDPALLHQEQILHLARELSRLGVTRFVLQACRSETPATRRDPLSDDGLIQRVSRLFDDFELRGVGKPPPKHISNTCAVES